MSAHVQYVNAPNGVAHTADTVRRMAKLARKGAHTYAIRAAATRIVHDVPGKDVEGEAQAIYRWVRDNIRYRFDPVKLEWLQAPARTIKERAGDCDDMTILIAALLESLGHPVQFETVGPSRGVQKHVYLRAWLRNKWVTLDPVLEPQQPTTAPRATLGMYAHTAPGVRRIYNSKGQPMNGIQTTRGRKRKNKNGATRLWLPTAFEHSRLGTPRVDTQYRGRGAAGNAQPIRLALWNNAYDPGDLSGLGFNFAKAIGSVAKIAKVAAPFTSFIPGASAITSGIDIASKIVGSGKAKPKPAAGGAAPVARVVARPAAAAASSPYAPRADGGAASPTSLAPLMSASVQVSRDAIAALERQNQSSLRAVTDAYNAGARARAPQATAQVSAKKVAKPKKRQRWDPRTRKWTVFQERGLSGLTPRVSFTLGAAAAVDLVAARTLAAQLVDSIKRRGKSYDRKIALAFQRAAGIDDDGYYGGGTAGAVRHFIGKAPPKPLFNPLKEKRYTPPSVTREVTPVAPASSGYAPTASAGAAPAPRQVTTGSRAVVAPTRAPAPRVPSAPINVSDRPLTRREMAANLVRVVTAATQQQGKPPTGVLTGAVSYQRAAGIKADGKWGPVTRAAAAKDLGVADATLPRSAWDKPAQRKPRTPAPRRPSAPSAPRPPVVVARPSAPAPSVTVPTIYDPVSTQSRDPGLPTFPGDPVPTTAAPTPSAAERKDNTTPLLLLALWYMQRKQTRRAA